MHWFFIALGAPFLWAIVNIADNYLVKNFSQKEKERSSGALVLFSSLIGLVIALIILVFEPRVFETTLLDIFLLLVSGILTIVWIILYLFSLEIKETSAVVPWFLSVPVFGYILSYFFLGETLTTQQLQGSAIIFFGLLLLSLNFDTHINGSRHKHIFYMFFACTAIAIAGVIFKYVTVSNDFWTSSFWEYLGLGLSGLFIFLFIPQYRESFLRMNHASGYTILSVNLMSEFISVAGNLLSNYALLLAPVTMVFLVGSFQPAIVLILSLMGTKFFPSIIEEKLDRNTLTVKIIAIGIMIFGSAVLFL